MIYTNLTKQAKKILTEQKNIKKQLTFYQNNICYSLLTAY